MNIFLNSVSASVPGLIASTAMGVFPWRFLFQKDARVLPAEKRNFLENKVHDLASKLGVEKKLEIREIKGFMRGAQAMGNTLFPGKAGIVVDADFFSSLSREQQEFVLAHEISHIKHNDLLTMFLFPGVAASITTIALSTLFPPLAASLPFVLASPACIIGSVAGAIPFSLFSRWREECADKTGFSVCSEEAKMAARWLFKDIQYDQIKYRNEKGLSLPARLWRKFLITKDGDIRFDTIIHPSLKTRIQYLTPSPVPQPIQV